MTLGAAKASLTGRSSDMHELAFKSSSALKTERKY